jgi:endothelin-converting enzyme
LFLGSKFDQDGNLKVWWDKETLKRYREKTQCFLKQYDNAKRFNDQFYLSENLADNIAIKFAYKVGFEWHRLIQI